MAESGDIAPTLSRLAAGILALAFAATLPMTLLANAWGRVIFSAEEVTDILAEELVGSGALQEVAVEALLERVPRGDAGLSAGILDFLGRQRLDEMIGALFPTDWTDTQISANVDNFYAWLDDDRPIPGLWLDIQPLKDRLLSGGAEDLANTIVGSWPSCGQEQVEVLRREGVPKGRLPTFLCQPAEPLRTTVVSVATDLILRQVSVLPPTIPLGEDRAPSDVRAADVLEFKRGLRILRGFSHAGWLLPLSILGLIAAVAVRSWPQLLRWWGASILAAGLGTFVMLGFFEGRVEDIRNSMDFRSIIQKVSADIGADLSPIVQDIVDRLLDAVSGQLFLLGVLILGIGLATLLVGIYVGRRADSLSLAQHP